MDWVELGKKYRSGRMALGLSIRAAAQNAGVSHQIWDFIERAQRDNVLVSTLEAMAKSIGSRLVIDVKNESGEGVNDYNGVMSTLCRDDQERLACIAMCLHKAEGPTKQMMVGQLDVLINVILHSAPDVHSVQNADTAPLHSLHEEQVASVALPSKTIKRQTRISK